MRVKRFMSLAAFAMLALLLFKGLSIDPTALPAARLGQPFPDFSQPELLTEEVIGAPALQPRPALVNVWATWCYSCRVEHPYLLTLAAQGVPIYGLNYKDESEKARQWLSELGDPYRLNIADRDGTVGLDLGVYGAPETYVLGPDGVILHRHVGVLDEAVFERDIRHYFTSPAKVAQVSSSGDGE